MFGQVRAVLEQGAFQASGKKGSELLHEFQNSLQCIPKLIFLHGVGDQEACGCRRSTRRPQSLQMDHFFPNWVYLEGSYRTS